MTWNLLETTPIEIVSRRERRFVSLPGLLAALARDEVDTILAARKYQLHAVHSFLCQLAALALDRAGQPAPPTRESDWADLLRGLTPDWPDDEPWTLAVDDPCRPAFLQSPCGEGEILRFEPVESPDAIDIPVAGRNHVTKAGNLNRAQAQDWIFALIAAQTISAYAYPGAPGIVRMNGGYGSRLFVGATPSLWPGRHFLRDVAVLLRARAEVLAEYSFYRASGGLALLWLVPWTSNKHDQLNITDFDPYFIEVARRLRVVADGARLSGLRGKAEGPRIYATNPNAGVKGNVGDPWAPLHLERGTAVTLQGPLDYETMAGLLFDRSKYRPALLQRIHPEDGAEGDLTLVARAVIGGEGKKSYTERIVPVPRPARSILGRASGRDTAGTIAKEMLRDVARVKGDALKPSALCYLQDAPERLDWTRTRDLDAMTSAVQQFDQQVDRIFFTRLFARLAAAPEARSDHTRTWADELACFAEAALARCIADNRKSRMRQIPAEEFANRRLDRALIDTLPLLREPCPS
ncbi:hypothetical protein CKO28_13720 [Rhodovibrio sodomensis]|uniref:Type I-E CRISPR-associated protein Cse1/CasA n=1 Tax=Rhodovibrio sodomensis TaxID=1088 RepID=A0ABS1DG57_9PROT|nr:hypothetical protein [Rhodovibrio sodomensis]MBK1669092.1 hypothetical protein [Rhodovibrio sodomensis]